MKRNHVYLLLAILIAAIIYYITCCRETPPHPPCQLPAPQNLNVEVVMPDSAQLEWNSVPSAVGYRIVVTDSTDLDTFGIFDTTLPELGLTQLEANHKYKAEVRAKCSPDSVSTNFDTTSWLQEGIIIIDEVVMMPGTGNENCDCDSATAWSVPLTTDNSSIDLSPLVYPGGITNPRVVYQVQVSDGTFDRVIKLAFDRNCNKIKLWSNCESNRITVANNGSSIDFASGASSPFLTLTIDFDLNQAASFGVDFRGTGSFKYRKCNGAWVGYCN
ncbi:MAG: fibronectin type III domain-containing protein [Saprospiraceae bacterium]|nr:fibronectin type III domain-containing protein [Saprospiraceae bacterium]MCF8251794.1 fibronectin type III domain-containing protein [Saprospiraceae bacterium]MCF8281448.1 fibronectin type III domain-containing protein [Bacteroidales bacterium]MCF8313508.1 fibronectin type III domain-containing protein [Saprospiraceae bacterium]MCF8442269.1 fibronectin type III domain-containing protein [Saprospiraceae bacterium]